MGSNLQNSNIRKSIQKNIKYFFSIVYFCIFHIFQKLQTNGYNIRKIKKLHVGSKKQPLYSKVTGCKLLRITCNFSWQQWSSKWEQSERVPKAPETCQSRQKFPLHIKILKQVIKVITRCNTQKHKLHSHKFACIYKDVYLSVSLHMDVYKDWSEVKVSVTQSCPTLCDPMDCSPPGPLSMGFSRQEYWSGLPFPFQGIFLTQGSNPSPALQADSLPSEPPGKPCINTRS